MEQYGFSLAAIPGILKRRWWVILAPIVLLTPLVVGVAYILPATFVATARVLVEGQQIPEELARSTVTSSVAQRVALIEQRLMTRQNLLDLAAKHNVLVGYGPMSPTEIVELMRRSTTIAGVRLTSAGGVTGVDIRFQARRAPVAAAVANDFLSLLLEQNLKARNERAFETSAYFRQERDRLAQTLTALETRIARFKQEYADALPDSLGFRREEMSKLQGRVFDRELQIIALREQRDQIEQAIGRGEFVLSDEALTPEEQEMQRLQRLLVQQRAIYAESHPAIRSLVSRLTALEGALDGAAISGGGTAAADGAAKGQRILAQIDDQIAKLDERIAEERREMARLADSMARTPQVELELNDLQRQYQTVQTQHQQTILKLVQAETGERLEVNQQAERFEVIEQAQIPERPTSPNRPLVVAAGLVGATGLGVALAILLELLNRSIRTVSDLERRLEIRPVVTIPYIETSRQTMRRNWLWRGAVICVVVLAPAALFYVDQFVTPLPLLMQRTAEKIGLDALISLIEARTAL